MIQQSIFTCCLVSAPQPVTTLHQLPSCTSIPPSALQIRPYSAFKSLSAIRYFLNRFFISRSISVCWLSASGLKIPMQTPWQQQDRSIPEGSPLRSHPFQDNNHERLVAHKCFCAVAALLHSSSVAVIIAVIALLSHHRRIARMIAIASPSLSVAARSFANRKRRADFIRT